jgi:GxxExxY protein
MDGNDGELLLKEEVFAVVGCAFEVLKELGHGLLEKPYENALVIEFQRRNIPYQQQPRFPVLYKGMHVGEYIPDLIVYDSLVVDTKVVDRITRHELGQMLNYLRITDFKVGLILNFKSSRLEWKRVILDK